MLATRIERVGPGLAVTWVTDPDLATLQPDQFAATVRADALARRIDQRWPGDGFFRVERPLLDAVSAICGRNLAGDGSVKNLATIRSEMRRWAAHQHRLDAQAARRAA